MVKHNNVVPNQHFHKKWAGGTTGAARGPLQVVTWFDQAAKKKTRRLKRDAKRSAAAPRPTGGMLRPAVHCPTIKYNSKVRLGRGFSLEELKGAGIPVKLAPTIGIAVDKKRFNKSAESLQANILRLKEYKEKLILFPKKKLAKPGKGEASVAEQAAATQLEGTVMPLAKAAPVVETMAISAEMKETNVHSTLRQAINEKRMYGTRLKMKKDKEEAEKEKKKK
jgi:large subunit ribosomal protein L13e